MEFVNYPLTEISFENIFEAAKIVRETIGEKWLTRKIQQYKKDESDFTEDDLRKFAYLNQESEHPLINWFIDFQRWEREFIESRKPAFNESVIKVAILGQAMKLVHNQKGFSKLISRLKQAEQFESTAFEIEVAAGYVMQRCSIEFVEEGKDKTPDLRVSYGDDQLFCVECKRRDALTERDETVERIWQELETSLLRHLGPKKLNYFITLKTFTDPIDANQLRNIILKAIEEGGAGSYDAVRGMIPKSYPEDKIELLVAKLSDPDEEIESDSIVVQLPESDRGGIFVECREEDSKTFYRNPKILSFSNSEPSDRVSGIVHSIRTANKQLPAGVPNAIWIRIPDNSWIHDLENSFQKASEIIQNELKGSNNQRVNSVFVITRIFERFENNGLQYLGYRPVVMKIDHTNPAVPTPNPKMPE